MAEKEEIEKLKKEIEELKKKLEESEKLKQEYLAGWQRARADLLNYKKEELKRVGNLVKVATENLILELLPILDNFDIAEKNLPKEKKEDPNIKGFLQIKKQILDFLKKQGVEEIKTVGEKLNLQFHEVVEEVDTDEVETGYIIEEVQKGYKINGRVLRPAKVKVAK
ncbi:MAG TPA: nucleotide exchange factor GrpE [bacterium]|nr:nucleotide exchange factor GrpE [bacterium]